MDFLVSDSWSSLGCVIRWYAAKFIDLTKTDNICYKINTNPQYLRATSLDDGLKLEISIPFGTTNINYNNTPIKLELTKEGIPLTVDGHNENTRYHSELKLSIGKEDVENKEDAKKILEKFVLEGIKEFGKNILSKPKIKNKLSSYIYSENKEWELLNKKNIRAKDTIYLNDNKFDTILNNVKKFLSNETEEYYFGLGIPYKYNILLHGHPGTGKTSSIYALAGALGLNICVVNFDSEMNDKTLIRCIQRAPKDTILVCEDIDVLFQERKKNDDFKNNLTFSGLLNCLDGAAYRERQIIVMTTNYECNLDSALKRPGRIDLSIKYEFSNKQVVDTMFHKFRPKDVNFKKFYNHVECYNITPACLQKYFIENMYEDNIITNIETLKNTLKNNKGDKPQDLLYN